MIRAFLKLSAQSKVLAVKISLLLIFFRLALSLLPLQKLLNFSTKLGDADEPNHEASFNPSVFELVEKISLRIPGMDNCLLRCLCAAKIISNSGQTIQIRFGVKKGNTRTIDAHAWLENNLGEVIFEDKVELQNFHSLD